jgi:hypothetical protein
MCRSIIIAYNLGFSKLLRIRIVHLICIILDYNDVYVPLMMGVS